MTNSDGGAADQAGSDSESMRSFGRMAGWVGAISFPVGFVLTIPAFGEAPSYGAPGSELAEYFSSDTAIHDMAVLVTSLLAIPIALVFAAVYVAMRERHQGWATTFLFGAITMGTYIGIQELFYAIGNHFEGETIGEEIYALLGDGSYIVAAGSGMWAAIAFGSLATVARRTAAAWYSGLTGLLAVLMLASAVEAATPELEGGLGFIAFFVFLVWFVATSVLLIRGPLLGRPGSA